MGARLIGHLRFMQLLLSTIFEKLKEIEAVFYDETPYDETCQNFDGSHLFESKFKKSQSASSLSQAQAQQINQNSGLLLAF